MKDVAVGFGGGGVLFDGGAIGVLDEDAYFDYFVGQALGEGIGGFSHNRE